MREMMQALRAWWCRHRGHRWGTLERRTTDFGMMAINVMEHVVCYRCGHECKRNGYYAPYMGRTLWDERWDELSEKMWDRAAAGHYDIYEGQEDRKPRNSGAVKWDIDPAMPEDVPPS